MNPGRTVMWMLGVVLLLAGAYLLFFEANLDRWVSLGVLTAGILLFVGLAVMGFASEAPSDRPAAIVREDRGTGGTIVDQRRTVVERNDRNAP